MSKSIKPPFTHGTALAKVKAAEHAWNTKEPEIVAQAYTPDSQWRNRTKKWERGLDYKLMKSCGATQQAVLQ